MVYVSESVWDAGKWVTKVNAFLAYQGITPLAGGHWVQRLYPASWANGVASGSSHSVTAGKDSGGRKLKVSA